MLQEEINDSLMETIYQYGYKSEEYIIRYTSIKLELPYDLIQKHYDSFRNEIENSFQWSENLFNKT